MATTSSGAAACTRAWERLAEAQPRGLAPGTCPAVGPGQRGRCAASGRAQCQDLTRRVLPGLSCHMPLSVLVAVGLQMGHGGALPRVEGALLLKKEAGAGRGELSLRTGARAGPRHPDFLPQAGDRSSP